MIASAPIEERAVPIAGSTRAQGVALRGLGRSFGGKRVLRGVDLEIQPGEFVAIVGRSGGGKTTLLRLITGLDTPTEGEVRIGGRVSVGLNRDVRVLFQEARLLPWLSVESNVALGLSRRECSRVRPMIEQVGLGGREADWPRVLSGGQRQRVALARALVSEPSILLLDEPLCSLDALTRLEMQELIVSLWQRQGFTAILITHDVDEAITLADRVLVLEDGRFVMELSVGLPRPRPRETPEFGQLAQQVLQRLLKR